MNLPPELLQLEQLTGDFIEYWGFKKIHGRIWVHLYLAGEPLDSATLMKRLKVSKGLMSIAVRDLLEYDVIRPAKSGRHGTVFYEANPDLQGVIANVLRMRETVMLGATLQAADRLSKLKVDELNASGVQKDRIKAVMELTESAKTLLETFLLQQPTQGNQFFNPIATEGNEW